MIFRLTNRKSNNASLCKNILLLCQHLLNKTQEEAKIGACKHIRSRLGVNVED